MDNGWKMDRWLAGWVMTHQDIMGTCTQRAEFHSPRLPLGPTWDQHSLACSAHHPTGGQEQWGRGMRHPGECRNMDRAVGTGLGPAGPDITPAPGTLWPAE